MNGMNNWILIMLLTVLSLQGIAQDSTSYEIFVPVDKMPEFPGGEDSLMKYLSENIIYPKGATKSGIEGTVFVSFVVCEDGKLCKVKTERDIGGGCGEAAALAVKDMPNWKPAYENGKPVKVEFMLPVKFEIPSNKYSPKERKSARKATRIERKK